jgi:putative transposase
MAIAYKKRTRLKEFNYKGLYRYFITICTFNKEQIFKDNPSIVTWLIDILREQSRTFRFKIWAYCFMPDHIHLLLEGDDVNSDLRKFISSFKQLSSFYYKTRIGKQLWQINYHDHVLRKEEDNINVAYYIFNNPVRKGIVDDFKQYKYIGSFEFNIAKL